MGHYGPMPEELLSNRLRRWRGKMYRKEAAARLDIPLSTYRKYESGKRTPNKLALAELERRMNLCNRTSDAHSQQKQVNGSNLAFKRLV